MLTKENHNKCISEVVKVYRGKRVVKKDLETNMDNDLFPVFQNSLTPLGYFSKHNCPGDTTYIISAGAAGEIGYANDCFWAADDCLICECNDDIRSKYLYYLLKNNQSCLKSQVRKASVPRLSKSVIEGIRFTLPSISEQDRIINILDKFDKLINDISDGLPAEIELRRKQYEHYRNKLLSFEELIDE